MILSLTDGESLHFENRVPACWEAYALPGSKQQTAEGDFGLLLLQTVQIGQAGLLLARVRPAQSCGFRIRLNERLCVCCLCREGAVAIQSKEINMHIPAHFYTFLHAPQWQLNVLPLLDRETAVFMMTYPTGLVQQRWAHLPLMQSFLQSMHHPQMISLHEQPQRAGIAVLELTEQLALSVYLPLVQGFHTRYTHALLDELTKAVPVSAWFTLPDIHRVATVKAWLDNHPYQSLVMLQLARLAGMNLQKLRAGFKAYYGTTIRQYRQHQLLQLAGLQLQQTGKPIKEIARGAGYRGTGNFCNAFKKNFHTTPAAYRKAARKDAQMQDKPAQGK